MCRAEHFVTLTYNGLIFKKDGESVDKDFPQIRDLEKQQKYYKYTMKNVKKR